MYVKDRMVTNLITADVNATVSEVLQMMKDNDLHRIPIMENGVLKGLITESVITSNTPNNASSLSIYEINYMLNNIKAFEIMIKNPITIHPDELLEEAALKMRKNNIGCLLVSDGDKLNGIITLNDIFDAFVDLLGYLQNGTRYVINIQEDKVGILNDISACFKDCDISISNLAVYKTSRGIEVVVIANGENSDKALDSLRNAGYNVTSVLELKNAK